MDKKIKKSDTREYTLMLVPHHGKKVRSVRIPIAAVKYTVSILGLLMLLVVGIFLDYRHKLNVTNGQIHELTALREKNKVQVGEIEELATTTKRLQTDMERLNSLDAEVRRMINREEVTTTSRSGGGRTVGNYRRQGESEVEVDIQQISQLANELERGIKVREESLMEVKEQLRAKGLRQEVTPSIWPTNGEVTSRFGWRSSPWGNGSDWHPGIDIANSIGTPIVATASGEVMQSEWYSGYGNMVQINHGNEITTVYGHNLQNLVEVGQKVKKGDVIAYLGSTGYSTGPHVHYEVRVKGTAVNPDSFLK